jgi:YD repeat-containing protein
VTLLQKFFQKQNDRKSKNQSSQTLLVWRLNRYPKSRKRIKLMNNIGIKKQWRLLVLSAAALCMTPIMANAAIIWYMPGWYGWTSKFVSPQEACESWVADFVSPPNYVARNPRAVYFQEKSYRCYYQHPFRDDVPPHWVNGIGGWEGDCPTGYNDDGTGQCVEVTLEPDHKQPQSCSASNPREGNPIIVATGNKFQTEVEYQSQKPFGLNFVRYYNSSSNAVDKGIGKKWRHGFNRAIKLVGNQAQVARSTGQTFLFYLTDGNWVGDVDIPSTLVELVDEIGARTGWQYQDSNDTIEVFNANGQLLSITNRAGQSQTFSYDIASIDGGDDNSDTLDKVTGFGSETVSFGYDSSNRISSITDPEGNSYSYSYDAAGNLSSVTYPDDTPLDDMDNPTRRYHYENTAFPSHLTGLTDETGSRVTWAFDEEGRAISSELDGGVDKSSLDFSVTDQVTVTNPLDKDTTYHFETLHGVKKVTQVEGHETESCAGANQNYTYDVNGYIESKTDWQGTVTTFIHNARGLEISRTEASGTIEARTITTQWHSDFRLPIKITSPGQVTDFAYDEKGILDSQTTHDIQP